MPECVCICSSIRKVDELFHDSTILFVGETRKMKDLRKALNKEQTPKQGPVDPIALFRSLKIRSGSPIKEIWAPQAEALQEWHRVREKEDVLYQLKTGAGKTLIGLVTAQSLVNESKSRVIYCCATNQLVEQTREKAEELGIPTATYMAGAWDRAEVHQRAQGPVITNYAAVFNGRSIFAREAFAAIVFDDAHTAHDAIRDAFTLSIDRHIHSGLYDAIVGRVAKYFRNVNRGYVFQTVLDQTDPSTVLMVPLFEGQRHADAFTELLQKHNVEEQRDLCFPWGHLGGRMPDPVITPGGRAGDTERLFLIAKPEDIDEVAREWAETATRGLKTVIMVPSSRTAQLWAPHAELFSSNAGHERIKKFRSSEDERLIFVARYDGIDLPDDACRVMIVDGLPGGMSLLDRFFEQHLERTGISDAKIASRFVQLLGRTSRGMSDYGAVFLLGKRLLDWVLPPVHRAILPEHVQKQISVGERLSNLRDFTARELVERCLAQTDEWNDVYEDAMDTAIVEPEPSSSDRLKAEKLARAERTASEEIWDENPERASRVLGNIRVEAFAHERSLGAWLLHWQAFATQLAGDQTLATQLYREAASAKRDVGALPGTATTEAKEVDAHSAQARTMAETFRKRGAPRVAKDLEAVEEGLRNGAATAGVHEEAIRLLGEYLGYDASRPEKETDGKGPDGLWASPTSGEVIVFDAKTKKVNKSYDKDLIGRSAQHALWAKKEYPDTERLHYIVGPRVPATPQSTIPTGLRIIAREELARVANELAAVYLRAEQRGLPLFHSAEIQVGLDEAGLTWKALPKSWDSVRLDAIS